MSGKVAIVMGSQSDTPIATKAEVLLKEFGIPYETIVISAHRNPNKIRHFALSAREKGVSVIIAIAGLAAHLPGVVASMTTIPVIGVPGDGGPLSGVDALYAIVQMPAGVPVACVGIGNAKNAALLAASILSIADERMAEKLTAYRATFGDDAT